MQIMLLTKNKLENYASGRKLRRGFFCAEVGLKSKELPYDALWNSYRDLQRELRAVREELQITRQKLEQARGFRVDRGAGC